MTCFFALENEKEKTICCITAPGTTAGGEADIHPFAFFSYRPRQDSALNAIMTARSSLVKTLASQTD